MPLPFSPVDQYPPEDGGIDLGRQPVLVRDFEEIRRRKNAALAVAPARQRLDTDDLSRPGVKLQLVIGNDLARHQRKLELFGDPPLAHQLVLQLLREELDPIRAHQPWRCRAPCRTPPADWHRPVRRPRDPDRHAGLQHFGAEADFLAQPLLHMSRDLLQRRRAVEIGEHDDELVAADTRRHARFGRAAAI
jgi:hypothetical protein